MHVIEHFNGEVASKSRVAPTKSEYASGIKEVYEVEIKGDDGKVIRDRVYAKQDLLHVGQRVGLDVVGVSDPLVVVHTLPHEMSCL